MGKKHSISFTLVGLIVGIFGIICIFMIGLNHINTGTDTKLAGLGLVSIISGFIIFVKSWENLEWEHPLLYSIITSSLTFIFSIYMIFSGIILIYFLVKFVLPLIGFTKDNGLILTLVSSLLFLLMSILAIRIGVVKIIKLFKKHIQKNTLVE
jgi:ABC-type uncharacterized transport system permease subunit